METAIRVALAVPLGLIFGSFLTVAIHRVPAGESVVRPRSRCPLCKTQILARDNLPVLSWLLLRGRCRACGAHISLVYPLTELATAGLFAGTAVAFERPWVAVMMAPFLGLMLALGVIDIRHRIIPNRLVYPSFALFAGYLVVAELLGGGSDLLRAAIGCLTYGGGLLVIALIAPKGMGMGDVKLAALIGLVLGSLGLRYVVAAAAAGLAFGGVGAVAALALGAGRKAAIPFGPHLAAGAAVAAFFGAPMADWYLRLLT